MRFSFRLAELLQYSPDPKRRPGVIKGICDATGLDRHQVASLLRNEAKNIPLDALSRLCDYLVEHGHATPEQLPAALFAVQAENFWELLARRQRLELCVGVRRADTPDWPEGAWVVASDAILLGELLNGVSTLGGTTKLLARERTTGSNAAANMPPHPEHLTQTLVWSPGQGGLGEALARAQEVYDGFHAAPHDKALVCLGSTKSNPVGELMVASAFGSEPFRSQDDCQQASERDCPIYMRFREHDPHPDSCWGGVHLSREDESGQPGIYYETADGSWRCCPCDGNKYDAAFVIYQHRESQGWLEITLGGFSGRATRLLARTLASRAQDFWPPIYSGFGRDYGIFIVRYELPEESDRKLDLLSTDVDVIPQVIRLDHEVIQRRIEARYPH